MTLWCTCFVTCKFIFIIRYVRVVRQARHSLSLEVASAYVGGTRGSVGEGESFFKGSDASFNWKEKEKE